MLRPKATTATLGVGDVPLQALVWSVGGVELFLCVFRLVEHDFQLWADTNVFRSASTTGTILQLCTSDEEAILTLMPSSNWSPYLAGLELSARLELVASCEFLDRNTLLV